MNQTGQVYWQKFLRTGQIEDYLRYCRYNERQEPNPRRRIEEASRHKKFY